MSKGQVAAFGAIVFAQSNGHEFLATPGELVETALAVAEGKMAVEALAIWFRQRLRWGTGVFFRVCVTRRGTMDAMPNATINVDAALKARLADLAGQTGQRVDEFVEDLLRRIADADVHFERGVPVLPRRPGAPTLSVEDVERLADGTGE